jgi:glycogen debranching enzyme
LIVFDLELGHGDTWACCLEARPVIDGHRWQFVGDPHADDGPDPRSAPRVRADPLLHAPFERARADLRALAMPNAGHDRFIAAGVPWFQALFGRDTLVTALMTALVGTPEARGALEAVAALQATARDDWRDAEPGKLPHELRRGELAYRHEIPHTPYYGTHDAPALFCLALWHVWRWTGDRRLLDEYLDTACAALRWCDEAGDRDGDGFLEYETRSRRGYYNQSWKDAGDAIVHEDGTIAPLPIATVELQGYWYAARLAMAELLDACGQPDEARRLRDAAEELRARVNTRFWLEDEGFYAMALDGAKQAVRTIASNPGQLLWTGVPNATQARAVARRLLEPDLFSGWGTRTLTARHPAYNPMSYQRGSVWPHDSVLTAAGFFRYGLTDEAATLVHATLEAACAFEDERLPELFCGFDRKLGGPVPYDANVPQAWAAAAPILAAQLFVGLVPDAPSRRCFVAPWLPEWLPELELHDVAVGDGHLSLSIARHDDTTVLESVDSTGVEVVPSTCDAPLWGRVDIDA